MRMHARALGRKYVAKEGRSRVLGRRMSVEVEAAEVALGECEKVETEAPIDVDAPMIEAEAPGTPDAVAARATSEKWPPHSVAAQRGETMLTLNQSMKAPKGYAYIPAGDYAPFEAAFADNKKRARKPSIKLDDGMFVGGNGAGAAMLAGDDSAKAPEIPMEELTEEERAIRKVQRKEQKRREKEALLKRLQEIEAAKQQVAKMEIAKAAAIPQPRVASARPVKAPAQPVYRQPAISAVVSRSGIKKSAPVAAAVAPGVYKKMRDGRLITNRRLLREHEVDQERQQRNKEMLRRCREVLNQTKKNKFHWIFSVPVDAVRLGIPDYYTIVKTPMDMGTVKKKLDERKYDSPLEFCADMRLIWDNCALYNEPTTDAGHMGEVMRGEFETAWLNSGLEQYATEEQAIRAQEEVEIRNTPADPLRQEDVMVEEVNQQLEKMRRELEELKREKREAMYKDDDDIFDEDEPVPRPKSRSRGTGSQKKQRAADSDEDFDFDDARMDEDTYKEFKEERKARSEIKRSVRAETQAIPKREMSFDEKHELTMLLQDLPEDKQGRVVQIVSERKKGMGQGDEDDEIEINIEELDSETLWKLDKYVRSVLRPKKRKLNAAEQLLEAKQREAQAARELAAVEDTLRTVQETGGSYQEVVNGGKTETKAKKRKADSDTDDSEDSDSDSDSDTSSYDSAEGGGSNPEKMRAALEKPNGDAPVDQSTNVFAKEATGIKQNASKAAVNVQNPAGWENLATSDAPAAAAAVTPKLTRQDAIPDDLWSEFEAAAQKKQELEQSRQEDIKRAEAARAKEEADKKAAEETARVAAQAAIEAKRRAEEEAKEAEAKAREEARAKARAELQNTSQTVDLEEQRLAMKQFGGDGMGGMMGSVDTKALKGDGQ